LNVLYKISTVFDYVFRDLSLHTVSSLNVDLGANHYFTVFLHFGAKTTAGLLGGASGLFLTKN